MTASRQYPRIVCEIGCNHMGDREMAKEMVITATQFCKADVVKFQKRCPREALTSAQYAAPHPNAYHAYGKTYGEHREFLEFPLDFHAELKALIESAGSVYASSVWDLTSAREIASLEPKLIKLPSAKNQDWSIMEYLAANYRGEIHISLGMTTRAEEQGIVDFFRRAGRSDDLALYACTSGYPVKDADVCLMEIRRLRETYEGRVRGIGFSGHHNGIAIDMVAAALGAQWIERHFTLDRTLKGTDHAASLEPDGLRRLKRDTVAVVNAMGLKQEEILPVEWEQRTKLRGATA